MTKTYIFAAFRIFLSLTAPGAAHAAPWQAGSLVAPSTAACVENDQRTKCSAPAFAVALTRRTPPAHPRFQGAEHPATPSLPPARSPDHDEDPFASMHFE